jgi:hypothetical protein
LGSVNNGCFVIFVVFVIFVSERGAVEPVGRRGGAAADERLIAVKALP